MAGRKEYCRGCRDDYYNQPGNSFNGTECWSLKSATVGTRYRIDWWTRPTVPGAFTKVTTNSCHYAPGRYALKDKLPVFAVDVRAEERAT